MNDTTFTQQEIKEIGDNLKKNLGPEWLATRSGPNGRLTYIEGKTAINIANEIFGFNGWSSDLKDTTVDFVDVHDNGRVNVGISVTIRITLKDGSYHEDIGYGASENARSKASAFEKARKQAVTDATKRALRNFGNALGNCIYDKTYVSGVVNMANPQIKFSPKDLYRHIQFDTKRQEKEKQEQEQLQKLEVQRQEQILKAENEKQKIMQQRKLTEAQRHDLQVKIQMEKQKTKKLVVEETELSIPNHPVAESSNKPINNEPPLLLPEDSFSYAGDDEFFFQMLANDEFENIYDVEFEEEELSNLVTRIEQSSSLPTETENSLKSNIRKDPPSSDTEEQSNKRAKSS